MYNQKRKKKEEERLSRRENTCTILSYTVQTPYTYRKYCKPINQKKNSKIDTYTIKNKDKIKKHRKPKFILVTKLNKPFKFKFKFKSTPTTKKEEEEEEIGKNELKYRKKEILNEESEESGKNRTPPPQRIVLSRAENKSESKVSRTNHQRK